MNRPLLFALVCLFVAATSHGQQYDLSWYTIDGGGAASVSPDGYELLGTIAQADADADIAELTADDYSLVGGFWAAVAPHCTCMADVNGDDKVDGADIQRFVECATGISSDCPCADVDRSGDVAQADVMIFVDTLLAAPTCH